MFKKLAMAAFAAASLSAFAQNDGSMKGDMGGKSEWMMKYDTYHIGTVDINSLSRNEQWRIVAHDLKAGRATDAYTINNFIQNAPANQSDVIVKALANNFKQASMVRDEVAQARFGTASDYAWLSYPPLTWSQTPGQNSWSNVTMTDTSNSVAMGSGSDVEIAMTDDSSRPMRMAMANRVHDLNYDKALDILGSNLNETERGTLHEIFHPQSFDPTSYTNQSELDSLIRTIQSNAEMTQHLGRWSWYNHFDSNYYNTPRSGW